MGQSGTARTGSPVNASRLLVRPRLAGLYIMALSIASLAFLVLLLHVGLSDPQRGYLDSYSWPGFVILLILALLAARNRISFGMTEVSAESLAILIAAATIGPVASFVIAGVSQLPSMRRGQWERNVLYASSGAVMGGVAALVYQGLVGIGGGSPPFAAAMVCGSWLVFELANFLIYLPVVWLRHNVGARQFWREAVKPFLPFNAFFVAISIGIIYMYRQYAAADTVPSSLYSACLTALGALPVAGLVYAFKAYSSQMKLAQSNARLAIRNERLALQAIASQITALDLKDNYTAGHSAAVSNWATDIASEMGLSSHDVNVTHLAGLLHDVGKIGVPDEVLNCPGKLDPVSWAMVETHCTNGFRILSNIDQFEELANVVLCHHERWDGRGYPDRLRGEAIPLVSRIICVADSYSAMVSDRPYRKALEPHAAKNELVGHRGSQFDPTVVDCFIEILDRHDATYQNGESADFKVEFQKVKFLRDLPVEAEDV